MKLVVDYPDVEELFVDFLTPALEYLDPAVTVGVGVPVGWRRGSLEHVQVDWDGTPLQVHPIVAYATVRIVAWAHTVSAAKALASRVQGHVLAHPGGGGISSIRSLTGLLPTQDPATKAELASFTVRAGVRSVVVEPGS